LRYIGNNSKKWDGKEILVEAETLMDDYTPEDLVEGKVLQLPWKGKGGKMRQWNLVVSSMGGEYRHVEIECGLCGCGGGVVLQIWPLMC
jgi:hypothetical protein